MVESRPDCFGLKKRSAKGSSAVLLALILAAVAAKAALAHQPFFENPDTTASNPMRVRDPVVSTAFFATLDRPGDVDFFTFSVSAGQTIEIGMTIPQIAGQDQFAPTLGVVAAGLNRMRNTALPAAAQPLVAAHAGTIVLEPVEASTFFEPFSRTAYWRRQRRRVVFPAEGIVHVVVWSPHESVGRYTLVVGQREVLGGEPGFARKLKAYWTPVKLSSAATAGRQPDASESDMTPLSTPLPPEAPTAGESANNCSWIARLLAALTGAYDQCK